MTTKDIYAAKAISQVPRILSLQDRNRHSPTYGSFHRTYWLDKTDDFADALPQFAVHTLALVYRHEFTDNPYYRNPRVRDWAIAGLEFWAKIQHADGSFDEFYPWERGWAGPTAFTTYAVLEAYRLLKDEIPDETASRVLAAARKAAIFISAGESEEDSLANHHAIAALAVWKAYETLGDADLKAGFERVFEGFLAYHHADEGWSTEYDGPDPGYLSATVSFLGKVYQTNPDPLILEVLTQSVTFCSYYAYPDGSYAGITGSRNTLHFYPHGFEILAPQLPLAAAVAERLLRGLGEGKLVPPEIMADRYVFYRVPELLLAYLDHQDRADVLPALPYEQNSTWHYFPHARMFTATRGEHYLVANLAKGGVIKLYERETGRLILDDGGLIGTTTGGAVISTQWADPSYVCDADEHSWEVRGSFSVVPSVVLFNPVRTIIFRTLLVLGSKSSRFSHWLKGRIRKKLMLRSNPAPLTFRRKLEFDDQGIVLEDEIWKTGGARLTALTVGGEFAVRYVPQSRYFQSYELEAEGASLTDAQLATLNTDGHILLRRRVTQAGVVQAEPAG